MKTTGTTPEELAMFIVNGESYKLKIKPQWTLAEVLREKIGFTGTKVACDAGACGACTVIINGNPVLSCMMLAVEAQFKEITTIEGLAKGDKLHPIQKAFLDHHGFQCGFCSPGMILSSKALLDKNPNPSEQDVREALAGNLCRCGSQAKAVQAVLAAAEEIKEDKGYA